jgi:hypothetical protein
MDRLSHDWLTEGLIDYEYKKYILLAYLKDIRRQFEVPRIYPFLADLLFHYSNLLKIKEKKEVMFDSFPKTVTRADFEKLQFTYQELIQDDEMMAEIEDIITYALPKMEGAIREGKELYDFVEKQIEMSPVGLSPIYQNEGYLFIEQASRQVNIFRYQMTIFENANENFRGIATHFMGEEMRSVTNTYEQVKVKLARTHLDLPNPATYLFRSRMKFPLEPTVLPIAKRMLVAHLSAPI